MNIDDLILKYIDGELTHKEDEELRQILSTDTVAKGLFDTDVLLHAAMREDSASIHPPIDLINKTEDMLLMKILASQPIVAETPDKSYKFQKRYVFASLIAVFLLFSILKIDDFFPGINNQGIKSAFLDEKNKSDMAYFISLNNDIIKDEENPGSFNISAPSEFKKISKHQNENNIAKSEAEFINSENISSYANSTAMEKTSPVNPVLPVNVDNIQGNGENNRNETIVSNSDNLKEVAKGKNINIPEDKYNPRFNANDLLPNSNPKIKTFQTQTVIVNGKSPAVKNFGDYMNINPSNFYGTRSDIQLSSFFGTDVVRGGLNPNSNSAITHFSQSIAYTINDKEKFGIEIGFSQYTFDDTRKGKIPALIQIHQNNSKAGIEELDPSGNNSNSIEFPYKVNVSKQIIWGSAFFEQSILNVDDFAIFGRVGGGLTSDGPLSYGRLFAKYQLFHWLSLTFGADGRLYVAKLPLINDSEAHLRSSAGFIYGFQVKF